jgi:hypothetical protein
VASVCQQAYPTRADLDLVFGKLGTDSTFDPESMAADREKNPGAGLKQMNLGQFGKE